LVQVLEAIDSGRVVPLDPGAEDEARTARLPGTQGR
jgi:hypothetical protein